MSRLHALLSLTAMTVACLSSLHALAGDIYEELDPSEISCGVKGASYTKSSTAAGYRFIGLSVEKLICEGQEIDLASGKFDGDFLTTRDYGKIKIMLGENTLTPSFSIWLTPDQKRALLATLKAKKITPKATK